MTQPDPLLELFGFGALWRLREDSGEAEPVATSELKSAADVDPVDPAMAAHAHRAEPMMRDARRDVTSREMAESTPIDLSALDFDALRERVLTCTDCTLCETRTHAVFGVGDAQADWLFVGEGPGMNEDQQGEPFVGQAGRLLDNMLLALGLRRDAGVFIANVVKCRPPGNRDPLPEEVAACAPYLQRQIALIRPKVIVALGRFAAQTLLGNDAKIGTLRGRVHRYQEVPVIVTYHPAYLLRTLSDKAKAWEDLCLARATMQSQSVGASVLSGVDKVLKVPSSKRMSVKSSAPVIGE